MDHAFLRRARKTSIVTGFVCAILISFYWGLEHGGGWAFGLAWSLFNLHFTSSVVTKSLTVEKRDAPRILVALLIKFPVLYAVGYLLLRSGFFTVIGLVAGFTWPFFVMLMKGLGRHYLKLDESQSPFGNPNRPLAASLSPDEGAAPTGKDPL